MIELILLIKLDFAIVQQLVLLIEYIDILYNLHLKYLQFNVLSPDLDFDLDLDLFREGYLDSWAKFAGRVRTSCFSFARALLWLSRFLCCAAASFS